MKWIILLILLVTSAYSKSTETDKKYLVDKTYFLPIDSAITPAVFNFLETKFKVIQKEDSALAIITLNTPGGLVTTTKDILTLMAKQPFPIVVWITPAGASATSAGAIIASGAHFVFMSEGTNIGAATPIEMSGDIKESDAKSKAVNDLVALVSSLSKLHGRSAKAYAKMITKAASYDSQVALSQNIINGIADNNQVLFEKLNQLTFSLTGVSYQLEVSQNTLTETLEFDPGQKLLNFLANPTLAYLLFMLGAALLYFEMQAPGGMVAGAVGVVCLIIAGIGFQVLPLNVGALGLIILAFILFILEIYITSFGILSLAGLASLITGSLLLFRSEGAWITIEKSIVFSILGAIIVFLAIIAWVFVKARQKKNSFFSLLGLNGHVTMAIDPEHHQYQVKIEGGRWSAYSTEELTVGDSIIVTEHANNKIVIKKE